MITAPKLGILAGAGDLPILLVEACLQQKREHIVLGIEGSADPCSFSKSPFFSVPLGKAGRAFQLLKQNQVQDVIFAGSVRRPTLKDLKPDWISIKFFSKIGLKALGDDGLLRAVITVFEDQGFRVIGIDDLCPELLAGRGILGRIKPDQQALSDLEYGFKIARALGSLDIGQAVVVQQGLVLGVEAIEGTQALLQRCHALKRSGLGGVLVKCAKPQQDRRVDLPTIGLDTLDQVHAAGLRGIALQAHHVIILNYQAFIEKADSLGLFIYSES